MKITEFENPLSGKKGNLLDFGSMLQMILGVVVFFAVVGIGQGLFQRIGSKIPFGGGSIESITTTPSASSPSVETYGIF